MKKLTRRDILKYSAATAAALSGGLFSKALVMANNLSQDKNRYQLAAVKNGSPERLFDEGIKALGGMPRFVKKGQTVLIKPNCAQPLKAEYASNTNPLLMKRIIEHAKDSGASKVYVFDHGLSDERASYAESGIGAVCKSAGAIVVPADNKRYYHSREIAGAKRIKSADFHEIFLEADVVINVPILKHHSSSMLTMSMKNLMGVIWNRWIFHTNDLHQCIADLSLFRKPDLNVIDAYYMLMSNGPRGGDLSYVKTMKHQILSPDIVAADAAGARIFGIEPSDVEYIKIGSKMKIGTMDLKSLSIARISLQE